MADTHHFDEDSLVPFIRGEIDDEAASVIRSHVEACPLCAARVADLTVILNTFVNIGESHRHIRYPGDLASELRQGGIRQARSHPRFPWRLSAVAAAAAALVWFVVVHQQPPGHVPTSRAIPSMISLTSPGSMPDPSELTQAKPDFSASFSMITVTSRMPTRPSGRLVPPRLHRKGDRI